MLFAIAGYTIELFYLVPLVFLILAVMANLTGKITTGVLLVSVIAALIFSYFLGTYQAYAIMPVRNVLFFGASATWQFWFCVLQITGLVAMAIVAMANLYMTHGKKLWT